VKGIGITKASQIKAVFKLTNRLVPPKYRPPKKCLGALLSIVK